MIGRGRGGSKTAELRSQEMEPAGVESDASRKDQSDVWASRAAAVRAKVRTKNCTSSFSTPRHQLLRLLLRGGPRNRHQ